MKDKAYELYGWLQDAVWDYAQGDLYPNNNNYDIENQADMIFNDAGVCRELLGDRIYDALVTLLTVNQWELILESILRLPQY